MFNTTHSHSQTPLPIKAAWVKALCHRAKRICSTDVEFNEPIKNIKKLMPWNSYAKQVRNSLLKRLNSNINKKKEQTADDRKKIWMNIPYLGDKRDHLTKRLIRKLNKCLNENVKFMQCYKTNKLAMFCSIKDQFQPNTNVVYRITCPGSYNKYIGKS